MERAISNRASSISRGQRLDGRFHGFVPDGPWIFHHDATKCTSRGHSFPPVQVRDESLGLDALIRRVEHGIDASSYSGIRLLDSVRIWLGIASGVRFFGIVVVAPEESHNSGSIPDLYQCNAAESWMSA
jgi:hypothetical protein